MSNPKAGLLPFAESSLSNELVREWTSFFLKKAEIKDCFFRISKIIANNSESVATLIANEWYHFSDFMPWFLSQAAAKMRDNNRRHYIIRVAYEELGERNSNEIHSDLFVKAAKEIGIEIKKPDSVQSDTEALAYLRQSLIRAESDSIVLGMSLGLEIVAYQNINSIFTGLAFEKCLERQLSDTVFFRTHFVNEEEHIRLTVSNFLRFCKTPEEQQQFMKGFEVGLEFWSKFWNNLADRILKVESRLNVEAV